MPPELDADGNPIEENKPAKTPTDEEVAAAEKAKLEAEKNKPSDAEAKLLKEVMKLKEAKKAAEEAAKKLEEKYGTVDLEAAKEALRKMEEAETKEMERKGEYDRLLEKQREAAAKQTKEIQDKLEAAEKRAEDLVRRTDELTLGNSFAISKFVAEKLTLPPNKAKALYADHFEIQEGKLVAYDKPKGASSRTPIVDAAGEGVDFDTAIEAIINADPDKDTLIRSEQKPGSGSKGNNGIDTSRSGKKELSSLDKISEGLKSLKVER